MRLKYHEMYQKEKKRNEIMMGYRVLQYSFRDARWPVTIPDEVAQMNHP